LLLELDTSILGNEFQLGEEMDNSINEKFVTLILKKERPVKLLLLNLGLEHL